MIILFVFCSPQQNSIKIIDCLNWMSGYFCLNNPIHKQLRLTTTLAFWSSYTDMDHANLWVTKSLSGKRKKEPWDNWLLRVYFKRSQKERLRFRALPFFIVFAIDPDKQNKTKSTTNTQKRKWQESLRLKGWSRFCDQLQCRLTVLYTHPSQWSEKK